jgi:hypothetical protein
MKSLVVLAALALVTLASSARAEDTSKTIVLKDYVVYGRAARPMAVTEVTKLPMQTTVSDLRQPFVQRVELAVQSKPF